MSQVKLPPDPKEKRETTPGYFRLPGFWRPLTPPVKTNLPRAAYTKRAHECILKDVVKKAGNVIYHLSRQQAGQYSELYLLSICVNLNNVTMFQNRL